MSKKTAMSTLGYAIALVIILGVVMIISAPMMIDKYKNNKESPNDSYSKNDDYRSRYSREDREENYNASQRDTSSDEVYEQLRIMEDRMNSRLNLIESRQSKTSTMPQQSTSDKYVCEIEGNVDADGNVTPIDNMSMNEVRKRKIVFVCEYRY